MNTLDMLVVKVRDARRVARQAEWTVEAARVAGRAALNDQLKAETALSAFIEEQIGEDDK